MQVITMLVYLITFLHLLFTRDRKKNLFSFLTVKSKVSVSYGSDSRRKGFSATDLLLAAGNAFSEGSSCSLLKALPSLGGHVNLLHDNDTF